MNILKVRVIGASDKFYPQYKWVSDKDSNPVMTQMLESLLCGNSGDWLYIYPDSSSTSVKDAIQFPNKQLAIKYATEFKDRHNPTVVWEG